MELHSLHLPTLVAPAEIASLEELHLESETIAGTPHVSAMLDAFPVPAMILNEERQWSPPARNWRIRFITCPFSRCCEGTGSWEISTATRGLRLEDQRGRLP